MEDSSEANGMVFEPGSVSVGEEDAASREFTVRAFKKHLDGDNGDYGVYLKRMLRAANSDVPPSSIVSVCEALAASLHVVCSHPDQFVHLLDFIFQSKWLYSEGEDNVAGVAFGRLLKRLVSHDSCYANRCYELIVDSLKAFVPSAAESKPQVMLPDTLLKQALSSVRCAVGTNIHQLTIDIVKIVPLSLSAFVSVVTRRFPHRRAAITAQLSYFAHTLQFMREMPNVQEQILPIVIDRLQSIDVAIKSHDSEVIRLDMEVGRRREGEDEEESDSLGPGAVFLLDEDTASQVGPSIVSNEVSIVKMKDPMAEKMDLLMHLVLSFMVEEISKSDSSSRDSFFNLVLRTFQSSILTTLGTRYVQFLIFAVCSGGESYAARLLDFFMDASLCEAGTSMGVGTGLFVERGMAATYLGSFLARANYLKIDQVSKCVSKVLVWLQARIKCAETGHAVEQILPQEFYAVLSALIHIFAVRYEQLTSFYQRESGRPFNSLILELEGLILNKKGNLNSLLGCSVDALKEFVEAFSSAISSQTKADIELAIAERACARDNSTKTASGTRIPRVISSTASRAVSIPVVIRSPSHASKRPRKEPDRTEVKERYLPFNSYALPFSSSLLPILYSANNPESPPPSRLRTWSNGSFDMPFRSERSLSMASNSSYTSKMARSRSGTWDDNDGVMEEVIDPGDFPVLQIDSAASGRVLSPEQARYKLRKLQHGSFHRPRLSSDTGSW